MTSKRTSASVGSMKENGISSTGLDIYFLTSLGTGKECFTRFTSAAIFLCALKHNINVKFSLSIRCHVTFVIVMPLLICYVFCFVLWGGKEVEVAKGGLTSSICVQQFSIDPGNFAASGPLKPFMNFKIPFMWFLLRPSPAHVQLKNCKAILARF